MRADIAWLTERPIAHRGFHDLNRTRWENTLAAFDAAAKRGYAIECDVHLSSDGVPVVFHDIAMKRLTGREGHVYDHSAAALAAISVGGTAETVPSLSRILELVAGRVPVVIELKGNPGHDDGLVAAVASALRGYGGRAAIMSFAHHLIRRFATEAPGIPCGLTAEGTNVRELEAHFAMFAHPVSFVSYKVEDLPNAFVETARGRLEMPVITWTVRDEAAVKLTMAHADQMTFEGFDA